jgi:hypothetical protein
MTVPDSGMAAKCEPQAHPSPQAPKLFAKPRSRPPRSAPGLAVPLPLPAPARPGPPRPGPGGPSRSAAPTMSHMPRGQHPARPASARRVNGVDWSAREACRVRTEWPWISTCRSRGHAHDCRRQVDIQGMTRASGYRPGCRGPVERGMRPACTPARYVHIIMIHAPSSNMPSGSLDTITPSAIDCFASGRAICCPKTP